ncbi:YncE family protein [Chitinophaga sp. Mgbs1]|uniref:YncE family protein n=2 Tax=Chitinophaga solisilvae TaxID=1233460 RepID=A0A433WMY7_9BACT|nr:YncE family protein [Chitinophaga solisilvae]
MRSLFLTVCSLLLLASCRKGIIIPSIMSEEIPGFQRQPDGAGTVQGFYLLNEGNMNMNKSSLDYVDLINGAYVRRTYEAQNPEVVKGLGDVGNDLQIYGGKLYAIINNSNKVEVLDAATGKRIRQVIIQQCRYITFYKEKAYVTSNAGYISVMDTTALQETARIPTGRNPEQMAIAGNKLYVANSGGYNPKNYERTVSVIDLDTQQELKRIDVAINLHRIVADKYGDLYVTSRGDYYDIPSRLYVIDTKTDLVKKEFPIGASNICINGNLAYIYCVEWSYHTHKNTISYAMIDVRSETLLDRKFITDGTDAKIEIPYGIAVDPDTEDVFVTDALDYVSPGILYCFDKTGKQKWKMETGDIPAHFAFLKK